MTRQAPPVLRTPRLTLRPLEMTDAEAITAGIGNFDVAKWLSSVPYPYAQSDAEWFIGKTLEAGDRVWAIESAGAVIGVIGVDPHFGYWLARPAWRKGYGFEAAHAVVAHWFSDPEAGSLLSAVFPGNDRSSAVLRSLGFTPMGTARHEARALGQEVEATELRLTRDAWEARADFTVRTARLTLRPAVAEDAAEMRRLAEPRVARNTASFDPEWSLKDAEAYLYERRWRGLPGFILAIERDGRFIGIVGIGGTPPSAMYALHPDHWGQGIATEAMRAFLPEVFARLPLNRLVADHHEDNPASGAVLRKLGFVETGRDMSQSKARLEPAPVITYALTRDSLKVAR